MVKQLLAAPMRYLVKAGGADFPVKADTLKVASVQPHEVRTEGQLSAGPFRASFRDMWDYDGTVRVDLTLQPTDGKAIDELTLEIPFLGDADVEATVARCRTLFEPYGKDAVKSWEAHVGHNLRSHLGAKMVFLLGQATAHAARAQRAAFQRRRDQLRGVGPQPQQPGDDTG